MPQKVIEAKGSAVREMDEATVQRFRREIHGIISGHNARLEVGRRASKATVDRRSDLLLSVFRDLWRTGYSVSKVANLRREHCEHVLRVWKAREVSRATAAQKWAAMAGFAHALGKVGMVPEFSLYWPVECGAKKAGRRRVTVASLGASQYEQLLERFGASDEVYWALRLEREVGMTREEALMTNLVVASARGDITVPIAKAGGQQARPIQVDTRVKQEIVGGAREFVTERGRERLCWRGAGAGVAVKRVSNAVSYQLRLMREPQES